MQKCAFVCKIKSVIKMSDYITCGNTVTEKPKQSDFVLHTHENYEIYYFIKGDADYVVEGTVYKLHPGDMLIIRIAEAHYLSIRSSACYERFVVNFLIDDFKDLLLPFNKRPLGKYNIFRHKDFSDNLWLYYLKKIKDNKGDIIKQKSYLSALLCDIIDAYPTAMQSTNHQFTDRATEIIRYINKNLTNELSLEKLCNKFFISKSQINRVFKQATGTTVWNYINIKRLFYAKELIDSGQPPTSVYEQSGFSDYTTFYRAYKKQFKVSPSTQKKNP